MEITERLLNDAGGWQTMKQARALYEMGRVVEVSWQEPLLQGRVREGETEFRAGLRIVTRTNIENLCSCRLSRQQGAICAHSVALGLAWLKPRPEVVTAPASIPPPASPPAEEWPRFSVTEGLAAEIFIILPPNFTGAWQRGSVNVGFEAAAGGKRVLLPALVKTQTYRVDEQDVRLVAHLRELAQGDLPGVTALPAEKFLRLLGALSGHPRVTFGKGQTVTVSPEPFRPELRIQQAPTGSLHLRAVFAADEQLLLAAPASPWLLKQGEFQPVAPQLSPAYHALFEREIIIPEEASPAFLEREMPALRAHFEFEAPAVEPPAQRLEAVVRPPVEFLLELEGSLNYLQAKLRARYGTHTLTLTRLGQSTTYPRDVATEQAALERLHAAGFSAPDSAGSMTLKGEPRILGFFAKDLPRWERDATVSLGTRFQHVTAGIERVRPRLEVRASGEQWFDLQVELASGSGERFTGSEIQRLLQSGHSYVRGRKGGITVFDPGMIEELEQTLRDCEPSQQQPGSYRIAQRHASFLEAVAREQGAEMQAPEAWRTAVSALGGLAELQAAELGSLAEVLRPYQRHGVDWLVHLARRGLAGILADEMGLGKTVQALAALRALGGKGLIVCPSSLVYNWQREAARFTPDRRVLTVEGPGRLTAFGRPMEEADLVITSYALLRRDIEHYLGVKFITTVLDEAQHIKNPETQNAQAAYTIKSQHRFVLTGTPVENSVRDLWSLMHFLMPGYLGKREDFRERYEKPIESAAGGAEQQRLNKRLRPFILRRRKRDVITELPDKIEQVAYCELTATQKELYAELLTSTRRQMFDLASAKDQGKARILMLTALLRLRQACCDPRLLQLDRAGKPEESAKLELLSELMQESVDGGHRMLIFSQFVGMLHLLREWLQGEEIDFCYLDGSTKRRSEEVDRFQQGQTPVFLISLKAGGVGLNLTAADTVVHYDPWWNPAVEAQATDRAHRIGQKKVVTAYKLIARGTVEEKILHLQQKKRQIIDATMESEEPMMQGLSAEDLAGLLE